MDDVERSQFEELLKVLKERLEAIDSLETPVRLQAWKEEVKSGKRLQPSENFMRYVVHNTIKEHSDELTKAQGPNDIKNVQTVQKSWVTCNRELLNAAKGTVSEIVAKRKKLTKLKNKTAPTTAENAAKRTKMDVAESDGFEVFNDGVEMTVHRIGDFLDSNGKQDADKMKEIDYSKPHIMRLNCELVKEILMAKEVTEHRSDFKTQFAACQVILLH